MKFLVEVFLPEMYDDIATERKAEADYIVDRLRRGEVGVRIEPAIPWVDEEGLTPGKKTTKEAIISHLAACQSKLNRAKEQLGYIPEDAGAQNCFHKPGQIVLDAINRAQNFLTYVPGYLDKLDDVPGKDKDQRIKDLEEALAPFADEMGRDADVPSKLTVGHYKGAWEAMVNIRDHIEEVKREKEGR